MFKSLVAATLAAVAVMSGAPSAATAAPAYAIVSQDGSDAKLRVAVRLDARHTPAELKDIADAVARRLPSGKQVAEVAFYLPAMALSAKPWAEARVGAADAGVAIHGLRLDEENAYRTELSADPRQRIGAWLTSPPALAGRLVLYKERGKLFAEWKLRNGQTSTDEVYEQRTRAGRRFDIAGGDGGYYLIDGDGNLVLGARGAVIALADPIKPMPEPASKPPKPASVEARASSVPSAPSVPSADSTRVPVAAATAPVSDATAQNPVIRPRARKHRIAVRAPKPAARPTRQADAAGDAITRALAR